MKNVEPYRILFPAGWLAAVVGAALWMPLFFGASFYPALAHGQLMVGGFLLAFVNGFLMTAVPKFTRSFPAHPIEIAIALIANLGASLSAVALEPAAFYGFASLGLAQLVIFAGRRFLRRSSTVPPFFVFVGGALVSGLLSSVLFLFSFLNISLHPIALLIAKDILFQGMILLLVCGIGIRLVPALMGLNNDPRNIVNKNENPWLLGGVVATILLSYVVGHTVSPDLGAYLRAAAVTYVALFHWRIWKETPFTSFVAFGMRISAVSVVLGLWLAAFMPSMSIHWLHMTFIAGFGLMTFMVASRVTLAHGGHNMLVEAGSLGIFVPLVVLFVSAILRVVSPFAGDKYFVFLAAAAALWVLAVLVWGSCFLKRMCKVNRENASC